MSRMRIRTVTTLVATLAVAVTGLGVALTSAASAGPPPLNVSGTWTLQQSNNQTITLDISQSTTTPEWVTGTATDEQANWTGPVSGVLKGDQLTFDVNWNSGKQGVYIINTATATSLNGYGYEVSPQVFATFTGSRTN